MGSNGLGVQSPLDAITAQGEFEGGSLAAEASAKGHFPLKSQILGVSAA